MSDRYYNCNPLGQSQLNADSDADAKVLYGVYYCIDNTSLCSVEEGEG